MKAQLIKDSLRDLNDMVISGKLLDAFEKHYHDDITMPENDNPRVIGKDANRSRETELLNNTEEFRGASIQAIGIGDDISFAIWDYDYTHREWGERKYSQVSVQHWKDARIIREQFFYGN